MARCDRQESHSSTQPNSWSMVWQLMVLNKLRDFIAWLQWKNRNEILDGGGWSIVAELCHVQWIMSKPLKRLPLHQPQLLQVWHRNGMLLLRFGVVIRDTADANIAAWCDLRYMDADKDRFNQWIPVYLMLAI